MLDHTIPSTGTPRLPPTALDQTAPGNPPNSEPKQADAVNDTAPGGSQQAVVRPINSLDQTAPGSLQNPLLDPDQTTEGSYLPEASSESPLNTVVQSATPEFLNSKSSAVNSSSPIRYRIQKVHAKGNVGQVSLAWDEELARAVAFKELRNDRHITPQVLSRFRTEAEVTAALEHPGVVPVYGRGRNAPDKPWYAMRFVQGDPLSQEISKYHQNAKETGKTTETSLALRSLLRRFVDVCNVMGYAHHRGFLHRDIKPANIMVGPFGETLVVDWGLAKKVGDFSPPVVVSGNQSATREVNETATFPMGDDSASYTLMGEIAGSPVYMSPEQARGEWDKIQPSSDIYSLGCVLYEILVGNYPFYGSKSVAEVIDRLKANGAPSWPREINSAIPAPLDAIVRKAMSPIATDRYQSAIDLGKEVDRWLGDEPVLAYPEPWIERLRRRARRNRGLVISLTLVLMTLTLASSIGLYFVNREKNRTKEAQGETKLALDKSQESEKLANEQRELALTTIRKVANQIQSALKNRPDTQDIRKNLLAEATSGLTQISRSADNAKQIDIEQVKIYTEIGDIYFNLETAGPEEANKQYQKAEQLLLKLLEKDPNDREAQRVLGRLYERYGRDRQQRSDLPGAIQSYRDSLRIRKKLAEDVPTEIAYQRNLAISYSNLARTIGEAAINKQEPYPDEVIDFFTRSAKILDQIAKSNPKDPQARRNSVSALFELGDAKLQNKGYSDAIGDFRETNRELEELRNEQPYDTQIQRDFWLSLVRIGECEAGLKQFPEAETSFKEALKILLAQVQADPKNREPKNDLLLIYDRLGSLYRTRKTPAQALEVFQKRLEVIRDLMSIDPNSGYHKLEEFANLRFLGITAMEAVKYKQAIEWLTQAQKAGNAFAQKSDSIKTALQDIEEKLAICREREKEGS
ncbi:serine/threonine protein kinase [Telmatocola sphagniphila]|uniref:Serine/threonine protein kinase n=1 Tax=Telmatocola sphagniphila TaxID=1123043 RepID=A0A8E6B644_9BACT|nr:serine/threonine-protein kinase [Telmatocola sphagniphila]QVL32790.1 serine/threonine protein kinase [Telmatocola sphagniphila]